MKINKEEEEKVVSGENEEETRGGLYFGAKEKKTFADPLG